MPKSQARSIVQTALAVLKSHPHAPSLSVLDLAMQGHHGSAPNFDAPGEWFGDWTDPASPFGELLRAALAPDEIEAHAALIWLSEDPAYAVRQAQIAKDWQPLVIDRFAQRYRLWEG